MMTVEELYTCLRDQTEQKRRIATSFVFCLHISGRDFSRISYTSIVITIDTHVNLL